MLQHLQSLIEAFVAKRHRQSWLRMVQKAKGPENIVRGMDALWRELDERYCTLLPRGNKAQEIAFIRQKLSQYKLTTCCVLSADQRLNQLVLSTEAALEAVVGSSSTTIISFMPGRVAYFEGHSPGDRYLCIREASRV